MARNRKDKPKDTIRLFLLVFSNVAIFAAIGLTALGVRTESPTLRGILLALGSTLLSTGVLTIIFDRVLRELLLREIDDRLRSALRVEMMLIEQLEDFSSERLIRSGIVDYRELKDQGKKVHELLSNAKESIRVCKTWIPEIANVMDGLEDALLRPGSTVNDVRILCLNPDSPIALQRSRDMHEPETDGREAIRKHLRVLYDFCNENKVLGRVKFRVYDSLPSVSLYAADHDALLGWYWHKSLAFKGPVLRVKGQNCHLTKKVLKNFDDIWNDARPYVPGSKSKNSR